MSGREFQTHQKKFAFCDEEVDAFFKKKLLAADCATTGGHYEDYTARRDAGSTVTSTVLPLTASRPPQNAQWIPVL